MGRSRSRRRRASQRSRSRGARKEDQGDEVQYSIDLLPGRRQDPYPTFDLLVSESDDAQQVVPHVCSRPGEAYVIRVTNSSRRHIACAVTVDGENALLKDGSLIVAPRDARELQGYLVSKNFVGKEYVKEYRDFIFSTPKVIEATKGADDGIPYTTYGRICCEVYEAELDEEVDSDQELRGQTTHYRGAGLHGSNDQRVVPEGKKKHFMYSAVTVQGQRSTIANSTRGRWWVRGPRKLRTLELRYRELHTLMLMGVDRKRLGLKEEQDDSAVKYEKKEEEEEKPKVDADGKIESCDLTDEQTAVWTTETAPEKVQPVDVTLS